MTPDTAFNILGAVTFASGLGLLHWAGRRIDRSTATLVRATELYRVAGERLLASEALLEEVQSLRDVRGVH